jgi:hypothetical protein
MVAGIWKLWKHNSAVSGNATAPCSEEAFEAAVAGYYLIFSIFWLFFDNSGSCPKFDYDRRRHRIFSGGIQDVLPRGLRP